MKRFVSFLFVLLLTGCSILEEEMKEITLLDGTPASLEALVDGRPAIVNFWASWCAPCKVELPLFEAVHQEHPEIAMIGINLQEKQKTAVRYWEAGGYSFPSLLDPNAELKRQFDLFTQPTTFFLDAEGTIVSRKDGPLNEEELVERVEELLKTCGMPEEVIKQSSNQAIKIKTSPVPLLSTPSLQISYESNCPRSTPACRPVILPGEKTTCISSVKQAPTKT